MPPSSPPTVPDPVRSDTEAVGSLRASWRALTGCLRPLSPPVAVALALAAGLALLFALYTNLIWEDFFITYRYSENLARGLGLVYSPGERVQGFTSVLNTLLPALFTWLIGVGQLTVILWCYRLVCLAGLLFALVSVTSLFTSRPGGRWTALVFPLLAALEIKTIAFTMSGQESGLVLAFLAPAFALAYLGWTRHWLAGGLCFAGLMYSRPDGCFYIAIVALAALAFGAEPRRASAAAFLKSGLVCAALYLPWFLFAWAYYGTPVPHTITAKYGVIEIDSKIFGPVIARFANALEDGPHNLCFALAPIYDRMTAGPGCWPAWTHDGEFVLELLAVLYWAVPSRDRLGRMASLAAFLLLAYICYIRQVAQFAPWYYPPLAFLSLLAISCALIHAWGGLRPRAVGRPLALAGGALAFGLIGYLFFASLYPLRVKQRVVEWNNRRVIGLWLKDHAAPGQTVYLEPLGYIGYFSQLKMLDWPGLVSPEVVAERRKLGRQAGDTWLPVAKALQPDWIVARLPDAEALHVSKSLSSRYALVKVFDVRPQIIAAGLVPGMEVTFGESAFAVFRRTP